MIRRSLVSDVKQEYPKKLYHWDGTIEQWVENIEQEAALGPGWFDSSAKAREERYRRFDAIKSPSEASKVSGKPEVIDAYYKRRYQNAPGEEKWKVIAEYNRHFPDSLIQFQWAG